MSKIDILGVLQGVDYCLSLDGSESSEDIALLVKKLSYTSSLLTSSGSMPKTVRKTDTGTPVKPKAFAKAVDGKCQFCYNEGTLIRITGTSASGSYVYVKCTSCKKGEYVKE